MILFLDYDGVLHQDAVYRERGRLRMAHDEETRQNWWDQATRYQQIRRYVDRARLVDWIAIDDNPAGVGQCRSGSHTH